MKKKWWITVLILLLVFGSIFGFKIVMYFMIRGYMSHFQMPPVTVTAEKIVLTDWQPMLSSNGQLSSMRGVHLSPKVSGVIDQYFAQSGGIVKAGDPILSIEHGEASAQVLQTQAAENLASIQLDQQKKLYATAATSKQALNQAQASFDEAHANTLSAQANLETHTVSAPFDGQLGILPVNLGQYVNPGDDLGMISDPRTFWLEFPVTQEELSSIKEGASLTFTVDAYPNVEFKNQLQYLDNYFSAQTYSLMARARVENNDSAHPLYPGMMINVQLLLPVLNNAVVVPQDAIVSTLYGDSVFLVEGDQNKVAKQVFIKTGDAEGSQVQIASGIQAGDELITSGQMKLQDGSPVSVVANNQTG